jgi:F0F1-type ATP synthase membrane subunit b/b'
MKFVIIFFLFLAISYYIFLERKKIVEGHETKESKAAATSSEIDEANEEIESKKADLEKLLEDVNALIEKEKKLSKAVKELEKENGSEQTDGDPKICEMTNCQTRKQDKSRKNCLEVNCI